MCFNKKFSKKCHKIYQKVLKNVSENISNTFLTTFKKMFPIRILKRFLKSVETHISKVFLKCSKKCFQIVLKVVATWFFPEFVTSLIQECFKNKLYGVSNVFFLQQSHRSYPSIRRARLVAKQLQTRHKNSLTN